jgi:hypothetical protein
VAKPVGELEPQVDAVTPAADYQADREARNPTYRWMLHLGLPTMLSLVIHAGLVLAATVATIQVGSQQSKIDVGEYEAGLVDTTDYSGGLSFDTETQFEPPSEDLTDLDDFSSLSEFDPSELSFDESQTGDPSDSSFGLGSGDGGGVLGIGESGIGSAGSGGFGGLGGGIQVAQAGVWNLTVQADRVVYVVDFSGSIVTVEEDLTRELKRSIGRLSARQTFNVILFYGRGRQKLDSFSSTLIPATGENKQRFIEWISGRHAEGGTEPVPAVLRAIKQKPQAIFFFSDGRFESAAVDQITEANHRLEAQLVCFLFDEVNFEDASALPPASNEQVQRLKRLAELNRGKSKTPAYKTVTLKDLYGS